MDTSDNIKILSQQLRQHIKDSGFKVNQYRLEHYLNTAQRMVKELNKSATNYVEFQIILNIVLNLVDSVKIESDKEE